MSLQIRQEQSIDIQKLEQLKQSAVELLEQSKAANTTRTYRSMWRHFSEWCKAAEVSELPAEPETVALYLADLMQQNKKASTIRLRLVAISQPHFAKELPSPSDTPLVKGVWNGIKREIGIREVGKDALLIEDLRKITENVPTLKPIHMRDKAMLVIGWAGAFRRSEIASINIEDIKRTREGLIITLSKSKTDQFGEGRQVALPYGSHPDTCPVRTLEDWLSFLHKNEIYEGAVFRAMDRHSNIKGRIEPQVVWDVIKKYCKRVGLDPERFGAHSLRSGFCTTAARFGKTERAIMKQTGHKSLDTLRKYIREATIWENNPASGIGL